MAIDSKEKRQNIIGVARPWMRNVFPVATPDEQWRAAVGNTYGGNALTPGGAVAFRNYMYFETLMAGDQL